MHASFCGWRKYGSTHGSIRRAATNKASLVFRLSYAEDVRWGLRGGNSQIVTLNQKSHHTTAQLSVIRSVTRIAGNCTLGGARKDDSLVTFGLPPYGWYGEAKPLLQQTFRIFEAKFVS